MRQNAGQPVSAADLPVAAADPEKLSRRLRLTLLKFHRWVGLAILAWLFLAGATGFFLGHPEWRWQHQTVIPWLSTPIDDLGRQHIRHPRDWVSRFVVDPSDERRVLSGGVGGFWFSADGSATWLEVPFEAVASAPQIYDIAVDPRQGWARILLATDDGIWRLDAQTMMARRLNLDGRRITSLQIHGPSGLVIGVIEKTILFRFPIDDPARLERNDLSETSAVEPPPFTTLYKYGVDLHAVAGMPSIAVSTLVNDYVGIALPTLCMTGFLYWYLPRRRTTAAAPRARRAVSGSLKWLFRIHVFAAGLAVFVPVIWLSVTGIAMGHKFGFFALTVPIELPSDSLTGNYDLETLQGELISVYAPTPDPNLLTAHTRLGGLRSRDGGVTWVHDPDFPLKLYRTWAVSRYRVVDGYEFASDEGNRHYVRPAGASQWIDLKTKTYGLVLDASRVGDSTYIYTWYGIFKGDPANGFKEVPLQPAPLRGLDLAYFFRVVHGVLIYNKVLVWFNDGSAIAAIFLAVTGVMIWLMRSRKWI